MDTPLVSHAANDLRPKAAPTRWRPIAGARLTFPALPGWVLLLTHDGEHSLGVWTNGRSVWPVPSGDA